MDREFDRKLSDYEKRANSLRLVRGQTWSRFAAAVAASATAAIAQADVIHTVPSPTIVLQPNGSASIDIDGDSVNDFAFQVSGATLNTFQAYVQGIGANGVVGTSIDRILSVFANSSFVRTGVRTTGSGSSVNVVLLSTNRLAIRVPGFSTNQFDPDGYFGVGLVNGTNVRFGFIHISIDFNANGGAGEMRILDWAYETTPGVPIHVSPAVPEPSTLALTSLGLLAIGFAGVRNRRQRLADATAAPSEPIAQ